MAFLDFIFGRPSKRVERNLYDPNQTNFLNNISGQIENILPMGLNNLQGLLGGMWPVSVMEKGLLVVWARMANNGPCASGQKPGFA